MLSEYEDTDISALRDFSKCRQLLFHSSLFVSCVLLAIFTAIKILSAGIFVHIFLYNIQQSSKWLLTKKTQDERVFFLISYLRG